MTGETRTRPFRWAIVGTGAVSRKFAHGLAAAQPAARVAAVVSRRADAARDFAAEFGADLGTDSLDEALGTAPDAIYIATPPALHAPQALAAIAAGVPVLVEKPIALDAAEARAIADAAREVRVFAMEAMWTRFLPLTARLSEMVASGELGAPRGFSAAFCGAMRPDPALGLFDPAQGGGALRHRGVYAISLARHFLGPVAAVSAEGLIGETGVDEEAGLVLRHASGAISTLRTSLRADAPSDAMLTGTKALIRIDAPIWRPTRARMIPTRPGSGMGGGARRAEAWRETATAQRLSETLRRLKGPGGTAIRAPFLGNGYTHEAMALMQAVAAGETESAVMPLAESVEVMEVVDTALARIAEGAGP